MPSGCSRRQFVATVAGGALAGAALPSLAGAAVSPTGGGGGRARAAPIPVVRVAVLAEAGFPAADVAGGEPAARPAAVAAALQGHRVEFLAAADLDARLLPGSCDVFVSPYGSAFPLAGWPAIKRYLDAGGSWLNLGGRPCAVPVERGADGAWRAGPAATTWHEQLGIVLACAVPTAAVTAWRANEDLPWTSGLERDAAAATVWELYYRLSSVPDTPGESGSAGAEEAVVRPLVRGYDAAGRAVAAPLVLVDRVEREFAGGRWIFATSDAALPAAALRTLVEAAARGPRRFASRPSYACYRAGETPVVSVAYRGAPRSGDGAAAVEATCRLTLLDERGTVFAQVPVAVRGTEALATGSADFATSLSGPLAPGLYRLDAALDLPDAGRGGRSLRHTTGFWVWDGRLLAGGEPLGAGAFALTRAGAPFVAAGTTYMASDVHRKFLFEPNPWLWDRDFDAMRRAGVNLVRTGIWTQWTRVAPEPGAPDEAALRALDAWLLTARRHDIPVIFTLFAFLPETWGGENAYLDPRAVAAQRAFVSAFARRYRGMHDLAWDLINEPSFCNAEHLWSCRPNGDRFEREAWAAWRRGRGLAPAPLPPLEAFAAGAPAADSDAVPEYRLFAQAMFERWVREMRGAIAAAGNPRQLVTVGQDEAGTRDSPNNLFLAPALDFTCIHTWWLNDAILWDEVMTRAPGTANLVEETGVMFSAHPPGVEARWEAYARDLLERKMALAVGPGGAGFVEWLWSSNCYMPSDNEAAIGLLRADGTAKPELEALRGVAAFVAAAQRHLVGRQEEPVLMVVPHSNMFSSDDTATAATKAAVRAMAYGCRVGLGAVSEFAVSARARTVPPLALVPASRVLRREAWRALRAWARRGSRVLVTGPLDQLRPDAARAAAGPSGVVRMPVGQGALLWAPQAVELGGDPAATVALYRWALSDAGIVPPLEAGAFAGLLHAARYRDTVLITAVAPTGEGDAAAPAPLRVRYHDGHRAFDVDLPAARVNLVLCRRLDGAILARYPAD